MMRLWVLMLLWLSISLASVRSPSVPRPHYWGASGEGTRTGKDTVRYRKLPHSENASTILRSQDRYHDSWSYIQLIDKWLTSRGEDSSFFVHWQGLFSLSSMVGQAKGKEHIRLKLRITRRTLLFFFCSYSDTRSPNFELSEYRVWKFTFFSYTALHIY